jgi:hypothetical protein
MITAGKFGKTKMNGAAYFLRQQFAPLRNRALTFSKGFAIEKTRSAMPLRRWTQGLRANSDAWVEFRRGQRCPKASSIKAGDSMLAAV